MLTRAKALTGLISIPALHVKDFRVICFLEFGSIVEFRKLPFAGIALFLKSGELINENFSLGTPDRIYFYSISRKDDLQIWDNLIKDYAQVRGNNFTELCESTLTFSNGQILNAADVHTNDLEA